MRSLFLAFSFSSVLSEQSIPARSSSILWTGRTQSSGGRVSFDWLNTQATFNVTGATSVWATLNSTFWSSPPHYFSTMNASHTRFLQQAQYPKFGVFRIHVDGVRVSPPEHGGLVVMPGEAEYLLVEGLNPSIPHNLKLWYTTDAVDNSWPDLDLGRGARQTVVEIRTDGAFAPPPAPRLRQMIVLGDSITSGAAMYKPCDNATTCDASQSYASLLCEGFRLNCTFITASSKGLLHNCCDKLNVTVPVLANRTFAQDNSTLWDWDSAPPFDAALINLGTNDGTQASPAEFSAAYELLLRHLVSRGVSHSIPIFAAWGPLTDRFSPWVEAAASQLNREGFNVTLMSLMNCPADGCGHPGVLGHPCMAKLAAPIIQNVTGWLFESFV